MWTTQEQATLRRPTLKDLVEEMTWCDHEELLVVIRSAEVSRLVETPAIYEVRTRGRPLPPLGRRPQHRRHVVLDPRTCFYGLYVPPGGFLTAGGTVSDPVMAASAADDRIYCDTNGGGPPRPLRAVSLPRS